MSTRYMPVSRFQSANPRLVALWRRAWTDRGPRVLDRLADAAFPLRACARGRAHLVLPTRQNADDLRAARNALPPWDCDGQDGVVSERFVIAREGCDLVGDRWAGGAQLMVLLHEGVADRRGWQQVTERLTPQVTVVAYDRRGHGESPVSAIPFTHVDDLLAVLDREQAGRAWLVGASAGGGLALDTALLAPDRVAGLVLLGTAVSGAPEPDLDPDTQRFDALLDAAIAAGNLDEVNRLETWLWLDGPSAPEGRVGGAARALALDMNAIILRNGAREGEGGSGADAWHRLQEVQVPVTIACGELDVPFVITRSRELADRLPAARYRELPGMAHQPYLEQPDQVADLLLSAIAEPEH